MKDWDKEKIERYFDTTELLKQMNEPTQIEITNPPIQNKSLPESKRNLSRRDEQGHRIPIVRML